MRNRTADLLLTMETLCLLSYRGAQMPRGSRHQRTKIHTGRRPRRITSVGIEDHTASVRCGFEPGGEPGLADSIGGRSQHGEVHPTNELGMLSGQRVEWAVAQHDRAAHAAWFVPVLSQGSARRSDKPFSAWSRAGTCAGLVSNSAAPVGGGRVQGVRDGAAFRNRGVDCAGKQLSGEVVSAFRQRHRQLSAGSLVQLGGPAGPWASTFGEALEVDLEQSFFGQLVEVELGRVTRDAEGLGGLVATDRR
jgi:hypothetical protein